MTLPPNKTQESKRRRARNELATVASSDWGAIDPPWMWKATKMRAAAGVAALDAAEAELERLREMLDDIRDIFTGWAAHASKLSPEEKLALIEKRVASPDTAKDKVSCSCTRDGEGFEERRGCPIHDTAKEQG